jgi:hypothetical protein
MPPARSNGGSRLAARAWGVALPLLYSTFSALVGTQSVLFSKTLAVLLRATFGGDNQVGCGTLPGCAGARADGLVPRWLCCSTLSVWHPRKQVNMRQHPCPQQNSSKAGSFT